MIEELKELLFSQNFETRKNVHFPLIDKIEVLLKNKGYLTKKENPISFITKRVIDSKEIARNGYSDLYGIKNETRISIEFDSGSHLKFKSIEKLLQSNASICIGIILGNKRNLEIINENMGRIYSRLEFLNSNKKEFWLFIISEKFAKKVF